MIKKLTLVKLLGHTGALDDAQMYVLKSGRQNVAYLWAHQLLIEDGQIHLYLEKHACYVFAISKDLVELKEE